MAFSSIFPWSRALRPRHSSGVYLALTLLAGAQSATPEPSETYVLPTVSIYSEQVANQTPVSTFAMPVSGLRFEPRVDVQARNLAEGQADISIRGGVFENTGFKLGALSIYDPQTGHYFAELPVAPAMLGSPEVLTGADNAVAGMNAQVGTIAYAWRAIEQRGEATVAFGNYQLNRQSLYQGVVFAPTASGLEAAFDLDLARSESDGSVPFGDHDFKRAAGRFQLRTATSQTDFLRAIRRNFSAGPISTRRSGLTKPSSSGPSSTRSTTASPRLRTPTGRSARRIAATSTTTSSTVRFRALRTRSFTRRTCVRFRSKGALRSINSRSPTRRRRWRIA